ncbi:MAG TPA: PAS domain-containing sensor histidine kinase, partial [Polyangia bacterium]
MSLRGKLVLAQAPLALALVAVGVISAVTTTRLGERSRLILADNYRSVLAAQRMKGALERLDTHALVLLTTRAGARAGTDVSRLPQAPPTDVFGMARDLIERELAVQEGNITEVGEGPLTARLRAAWTEARSGVDRFAALPSPPEREALYFGTLEPAFARVRAGLEEILVLNQDAMV